MYNISYFIHVKDTDSKITQETFFEMAIKETWCLVPEYHVFDNMYNISFYIHVKDTDSKSPKKRCFKRLLKKPDVLFLNIMFLTICTIFLFIHVKDTDSKITQETLFQTVIKETWCLVPEYHIFNNMYNISFYTCKGHWFQNHPRNVVWNGCLKQTDFLLLNIILLTICMIFLILYM